MADEEGFEAEVVEIVGRTGMTGEATQVKVRAGSGPGRGKIFVRRDGTIHFFCSSKCERNLFRLGRVPRWTPWTKPYRRAKGLVTEEAPTGVPVTEEAIAEPGTEALLDVEAPKGKAIPADVIDLIDHPLGPDLPRAEGEAYFSRFAHSETPKVQITPRYRKKHGGKNIEKVELQEFIAFLVTTQGRNTLKRWLDEGSKRMKGRRGGGGG